MENSRCVEISHDNITVSFDAAPRPIRTMNKHRFAVELQKGDILLDDAVVTLDFSMPGMYMGINRSKMDKAGKGRYEAEWVIPPCPAGGKIWVARIYVEKSGRVSQSEFVFEVR